jgi:hypothetical protein
MALSSHCELCSDGINLGYLTEGYPVTCEEETVGSASFFFSLRVTKIANVACATTTPAPVAVEIPIASPTAEPPVAVPSAEQPVASPTGEPPTSASFLTGSWEAVTLVGVGTLLLFFHY